MSESLSDVLLNAAQDVRSLAHCAPDIGNELRRFAGDLESEAPQLRQRERGKSEDAASVGALTFLSAGPLFLGAMPPRGPEALATGKATPSSISRPTTADERAAFRYAPFPSRRCSHAMWLGRLWLHCRVSVRRKRSVSVSPICCVGNLPSPLRIRSGTSCCLLDMTEHARRCPAYPSMS